MEAFKSAKKQKNKKPFITITEKLSYGVLVDQIERLTSFYKKNHISSKDRVIISSHDDKTLSVLFLSLLCNGITAVILDPETKMVRAQSIIKTIVPKAFIIDHNLKKAWNLKDDIFVLKIKKQQVKQNLFSKLMGEKKGGSYQTSYPGILEQMTPLCPMKKIDPESNAYILFTSGTTSQPKGVQITHSNLFSHLKTLSKKFGYSNHSRILNILSLSHADGIIQGPVIAFANGASIYRPVEFSVSNIEALLDAVYFYRDRKSVV